MNGNSDTLQAQPSRAINASNHGAAVTIVAVLCIICSCLVLALRLSVRRPLRSLFGRDDLTATLSLVFACAQSALILAAVPNGLGKKDAMTTENDKTKVAKMIYASSLLFVLSLTCSKISVAALFMRISSRGLKYRLAQILATATILLGVAAMFTIGIQDNASMPWAQDSHAIAGRLHRWIVLAVISLLIEVGLLAFPFYLVSDLQMQLPAKMTVLAGFLLRLPIVPITILRLVSLSGLKPENYEFDYVMPEIWTQLELHFSFISATIPCLRMFMKSLNTGYYGSTVEQCERTQSTLPGLSKTGFSYGLSTLESKSGTGSQNKSRRGSEQLRSFGRGLTMSTAAPASKNRGSASSDRSDRGIMVQQTVDVEFERPATEQSQR